jgi:excisionase family DNA binding protein
MKKKNKAAPQDDAEPQNSKEVLNANELLSPREAAQLKGVTTAAIYLAIKEGRLPHIRVLGRIGLRELDVKAWTPISYAGRPGAKGRRPPGLPMSEEAKGRLSESLKRRWAERKQEQAEEG